MSESAPKQLPALQWDILSRSSKPLDWAWVGGVVLVSVVVGMLLGAKYIGLALILYVFVFCMTLRRQIRVNYPAEEGAVHQLGGGQFNFPQPPRAQVWAASVAFTGGMVIVAQLVFIFIPKYAATTPTIFMLLICVGSLLLRYRAVFITCLGGAKLTEDSDKYVRLIVGKRQHNGRFSLRRLWWATAWFLLLWVGMCYSYANGLLGGGRLLNLGDDIFQDAIEQGGMIVGKDGAAAVFLPALLHLLFLEALLPILRGWGEYYNG